MSSSMLSMASWAVVSSVAASARIRSPTNFGSLVRRVPAPSSSAVSTPITPSIASARDASIRLIRPWGMGLVSSRAKTMPSARTSSAYFALPVTFARTSGGVKSFPMRLYAILVPPLRQEILHTEFPGRELQGVYSAGSERSGNDWRQSRAHAGTRSECAATRVHCALSGIAIGA